MANQNFYIAGGALAADSNVYIPRRADDDLLDLCQARIFAHVLAPRQMGKSSLRLRTGKRLADGGVTPLHIDLNTIGKTLSPQEWYFGLLTAIEDELPLDTDIVNWWQSRNHLGPLQRLVNFFRDVLLVEIQQPVVVFIDEIDSTLGLDFADDFFAAARAIHDARHTNSSFQRLSFVFIGVATPNELVKDPTRTPFNIGERVEVTDFTFQEARPLADGLGLPRRLALQTLSWVLTWTNGHPYLTQRICQEISRQNRNSWSEADVIKIVRDIFLLERTGQDDNLQSVRRMLTQRTPDLAETLSLYRHIRSGLYNVPDAEHSMVVSYLKLSGIVRTESGTFRVRNRIYEAVFDETWIDEVEEVNQVGSLQEVRRLREIATAKSREAEAAQQRANAEQQRATIEQRRATEQAEAAAKLRWRLVAVSIATVLAIILMIVALVSRETAVTERDRANEQARIAVSRQLAAQALNLTNTHYDLALLLSLEANRIADTVDAKSSLFTNLRNNSELTTFLHPPQCSVLSLDFDVKEQIIAAGCNDGSIILWDATDWDKPKQLGEPLTKHTAQVNKVAFSSKGLLASASDDSSVILWDVKEKPNKIRFLQTLKLPNNESPVISLAFSRDGRILAGGDADGKIMLWDVTTNQKPILLTILSGHEGQVNDMFFRSTLIDMALRSAQFDIFGSSVLVTSGSDKKIILWDTSTPTNPQKLNELSFEYDPSPMDISPNGQILIVSQGSRLYLWDLSDLNNPKQLSNTGYGSFLDIFNSNSSFAFSQDGSILAIGRESNTIDLWNVSDPLNPQHLGGTLSGHSKSVNDTVFGFGKFLISGSSDGKVILWNLDNTQRLRKDLSIDRSEPVSGTIYSSLTFNNSGDLMISGSIDGFITFWDASNLNNAKQIGSSIRAHSDGLSGLALSPDGLTLALGGDDGQVIIWNVIGSNSIKIKEKLVNAHNEPVKGLIFGPDSQVLVSKSNDATIIWGIETLGKSVQLAKLINKGGHESRGLALSPDGKILATAGTNDIELWNISTSMSPRKLGNLLRNSSSNVISMVFSSNGQILASSYADNSIIFWDMKEPSNPHLLGNVVTPGGSSAFIDIDPTGQMLAHGTGFKNELILWDITDLKNPKQLGTPLLIPSSYWLGLTGLFFSPDGKKVALQGLLTSTIALYDVSFDSWKVKACRITNRNLTQGEIEHFIPAEFRSSRPTCPNLLFPADAGSTGTLEP